VCPAVGLFSAAFALSGISSVDAQHVEILQLADKLHVAMTSGTAMMMIEDFLQELEVCLAIHLGTEERLMETFRFDRRTDHIREHDRARDAVARLRAASGAGSMPIAFDTMEFLRGWLRPHLEGPDRELGDFLREHYGKPVESARPLAIETGDVGRA